MQLERDERAIKQEKGKSDMRAILAGQKKTVKSFYLCYLSSFYSIFKFSQAGGKVGHLVCDYCFLFPR